MSRTLRILHVDDDAVNRLVLDQMLQAFGHQTTAASSGHEALAALQARAYDLVMTDLHMPELSGEALLAAIRCGDPCIPVLAVSADVLSQPADAYLQIGFAGFLSKPLTFARLESALDQVRFGAEGPMLAQAKSRMEAYLKASRGGRGLQAL